MSVFSLWLLWIICCQQRQLSLYSDYAVGWMTGFRVRIQTGAGELRPGSDPKIGLFYDTVWTAECSVEWDMV